MRLAPLDLEALGTPHEAADVIESALAYYLELLNSGQSSAEAYNGPVWADQEAESVRLIQAAISRL